MKYVRNPELPNCGFLTSFEAQTYIATSSEISTNVYVKCYRKLTFRRGMFGFFNPDQDTDNPVQQELSESIKGGARK